MSRVHPAATGVQLPAIHASRGLSGAGLEGGRDPAVPVRAGDAREAAAEMLRDRVPDEASDPDVAPVRGYRHDRRVEDGVGAGDVAMPPWKTSWTRAAKRAGSKVLRSRCAPQER